jgi:hypothetical protein
VLLLLRHSDTPLGMPATVPPTVKEVVEGVPVDEGGVDGGAAEVVLDKWLTGVASPAQAAGVSSKAPATTQVQRLISIAENPRRPIITVTT